MTGWRRCARHWRATPDRFGGRNGLGPSAVERTRSARRNAPTRQSERDRNARSRGRLCHRGPPAEGTPSGATMTSQKRIESRQSSHATRAGGDHQDDRDLTAARRSARSSGQPRHGVDRRVHVGLVDVQRRAEPHVQHRVRRDRRADARHAQARDGLARVDAGDVEADEARRDLRRARRDEPDVDMRRQPVLQARRQAVDALGDRRAAERRLPVERLRQRPAVLEGVVAARREVRRVEAARRVCRSSTRRRARSRTTG